MWYVSFVKNIIDYNNDVCKAFYMNSIQSLWLELKFVAVIITLLQMSISVLISLLGATSISSSFKFVGASFRNPLGQDNGSRMMTGDHRNEPRDSR